MARSKVKAKAKSKPKPKAAKAKTPAKAKALAKKTKPAAKAKGRSAAPVRAAAGLLSEVKWSEVITPLDDRVLVETETFAKTAGGLFIPATSSEKPKQGKVLAVGRGHRNKKGQVRPMDVRPGDVVLFAPYAGFTMNVGGQDLLILRESDLLGIVD